MTTFDEWFAEVKAIDPRVSIAPWLRTRFDDPNGYKYRCRSFTLLWAMGKPVHNKVDDECCPDFSCCNPELFTKDDAKRWDQYHDLVQRQKLI